MKKTVMGFIAAAISTLIIFPAWAGEWQQDGQGWRYLKDDGEYAVNVLYLIGEDRYGFDENGYMITGWYEGSQGWRYFYDNGVCARKAWVEGKYYIDGKGIMMTNAWTPDGYYVGEDGVWIEGYEETSNDGKKSDKEEILKYYWGDQAAYDKRTSNSREPVYLVKGRWATYYENNANREVADTYIEMDYHEDLGVYIGEDEGMSGSPREGFVPCTVQYTLKVSNDGSSCRLTITNDVDSESYTRDFYRVE